jgi:hypothetical protein
VRRKLAGGATYVALSDFLHDLDLIWDNAVAFNGPASAVGGAALDMRARVKAALSRRRPSFELSSHAQYCMGCGGEASRDKNVLVMCDVCDCSLHQSCGAPQRLRASGSWVCDRCAAAAAAAVAAAAAAVPTVESEGGRGDSGKAPAAGKRARTAGAGDVGAGGRGSKAARMDAGAAALDVGAALDASPEADGGGGAGEEEEEDAEASDAEMGEPVAEYTLGDVTFSRLGGFEVRPFASVRQFASVATAAAACVRGVRGSGFQCARVWGHGEVRADACNTRAQVAEAPSPQRLRASIQQQRAGASDAAQQQAGVAAQQQAGVAAQQQARLAARNAQVWPPALGVRRHVWRVRWGLGGAPRRTTLCAHRRLPRRAASRARGRAARRAARAVAGAAMTASVMGGTPPGSAPRGRMSWPAARRSRSRRQAGRRRRGGRHARRRRRAAMRGCRTRTPRSLCRCFHPPLPPRP